MTRQETTRVVRKVSAAFVIAAVLAVVLAGTAIAAVIGVPETLQEWFGQQWTESGGGEMPKEQSAMIDSLVQPIGVSDTNNGVTVTLESVTPGENCLWLQLEAEGADFSNDGFVYSFDFIDLAGPFVEAHKSTDPGVGMGLGYNYPEGSTGVTKDGKLRALIQLQMNPSMPYQEGGEWALKLMDLTYRTDNDSFGVEGNLVSGEWNIPFTIKPVENHSVLTVESARIPSLHEGEDLVPIKDIRVSSTGLTYIVDADFSIAPDGRIVGQRTTMDIALQLSSGIEVQLGSYNATWAGEYEKSPWEVRAGWTLPVDLSQVESVRFGDVVIPLKQTKK